MPSRTTVDEANLIMSPNASKNSKTNNSSKKQRDPPADPPGIPVDADFARISPRRTQSDTDAISPKKPRSGSKLRDKKGVTRRKSADGDDFFTDMLPPPIPMLPPSPTGGKQKKSKLKDKGAGARLPPKSPVKRSQHSRDSVPKSPGILKPSKYTSTPNQKQPKDNARISSSPSKLRKSLQISPLDETPAATPTKKAGSAVAAARRNRSPSPSQRVQVAKDIADQEAKILSKLGKSSPSSQRQQKQQGVRSSASSTESTSSSQTKKVKNSMDTKPAAKNPTTKDTTSSTTSSKSSKKSKSASKSSIRAPSPLRAPSPSRQEIATELAEQETKMLSKDGRIKDATNRSSSPSVSRSATSSSQAQQQQQQGGQTPGAYLVQGPNVALATSGMLSPHEQSNSTRNISSSQNSNNKQQQRRTSSEANSSRTAATATTKENHHPQQQRRRPNDLDCAPPVVAGSVPALSNSNLVVAAELSTEFSPTDIESLIEQQVQQRLQQNTVRANVVSVVHGKTLYDPEVEARRLADLKELHKPKGMKEKLFGDTRNADVDIAASPDTITKRVYLKWTVRRNPATNLWVASVQTSQKAVETSDTIEIERNTLSFPATTQQEAFETGLANATPLLHPTEQHPICNVCKAKFALFRQPRHCRNCGVCICSSCCVNWPSKMLPETYQTKNTSQSQICLACDFLANSFRDALLEGDFKSAQHLYSTGNVNLRTPFCIDRKAEAMYPIHLAILGGNVKIVKWLCSERFCPLRMPKKRGKKDGPIVTSKGRSALGIALLHQKLDIVRYLVAEMDVSLFEEKHINTNMALANFTSLLKMLPENIFDGKKMITTAVPNPSSTAEGMSVTGVSSLSSDSQSPASSVRRPSLP